MNDDLIRRSSVKEELKAWAICINHPQFYKVEDADHVIDTIPAVEAVPRAAVEQIKWALEAAIRQLKAHGINFCGKAPITNADQFRAASDEEMADKRCVEIKGLAPCSIFVAIDVPEKQFLSRKSAVEAELSWLQQPAEEG